MFLFFFQGGCLHNTTSAKFILLGEKSSNRLNPQQILLIKKTSRKENTNDYDSAFFFFSYVFNDQDLCLQAKMALHLCRLLSKLAKHNFQQRAHNQFRLLNFKVSRWPQ